MDPPHPRYPRQTFNPRQFYGSTPPTPKLRPTSPTNKLLQTHATTPPTPELDPCHPRTHASRLLTPPTHSRYPRHPRYLADSSVHAQDKNKLIPWNLPTSVSNNK